MKIRFGIIGCGYIAVRHAGHILAHPLAQLVSAYDINSASTISFCQSYGIHPCDTLKELLSDRNIDVVVICTPNATHSELSILASSAGKHVLVEKPMAIAKADCEKMIAAAENANKELFVVKQNRFNPPVQEVKKLLERNALGKIFMVTVNCFWNRNKEYYLNSDWKGKKDMDGGTLFTQFSHFIDILYFLFGDIKPSNGIITNAAHHDLIEFEDSGNFQFTFQNNAIGSFTFTTNSYKKNMEASITIFAENGTIKIGGKYLNTIDYQCTNNLDIAGLPESGPPNNYGHYEGSMSNHDKVINNVIQTLNNHATIMTNAYDGMKVVEIIENVYKVSRTIY